ncbi:MAG: guanylate kinase [Candidatus Marinimicrobia bacterium]|nr:guanylate kinase [Candidatus Neomarinimicrobiota bacterium]MCF7850708.1 guanylate kinase [Candidatus Neomarinimicrobiota bacterium]MCF7904909.1 guanylate kinase [Candidatus Neomarinimicrobiota bacterium]
MTIQRGNLIIVAGPSGAGKGTIENAVMEAYPDIEFSVSVTTRPRREYEVEGKHYFFISKDEFLQKIRNDELVEWQEVYSKNGHLYGTLRSYIDDALNEGKRLLLDIDIKGGIKVKQAYPDESISIFIEPPSREALEQRLLARGTDSKEQIQIRLERASEELDLGQLFDYKIVNSDLEDAVQNFKKLLNENIYHQ